MNYKTPSYLYFLISIFLSNVGFLSSQNIELIHDDPFTKEQIELFKSIKPQLKSIEQRFASKQANFSQKNATSLYVNYIPVKIHIIRDNNGAKGLNISKLENALGTLNESFEGSDLEFFICGDIDYIDASEYVVIKKGEIDDLLESNNVENVINLYFSPSLINEYDQVICGYSNNSRGSDFIVLKNSCASNISTLSHEMGHYFSLLHTHGTDNNGLTTELVDGSNCDTDGDGICDTPADPKLSSSNVNDNCEYTGSETDAHGHAFNPDTENIMSYSKKQCRTHFSNQQLARMYAFYVTQKHYLSCASFSADFSASNTETCEETLAVNFNNNSLGVTKWEWDINSDGVIDYTEQNPSHTFETGIYDVTLTVYKESKQITKTYDKLIKVGIHTEYLFDENFNSFEIAGDNGWTVKDVNNSGYNWLITHGDSPSEETGPLIDHHNAKGELNKFIYTEASGANKGDIAEFISPCIDIIHENSELEFAYHMFGENIGELHIDIKTSNGYINDVVKPIIGSQQMERTDAFLNKTIDLSSYVDETINIRFRAVRGDGWKGDIAIDNVFLKTISVPISDDSVRLYPNPVKGNLLFVKADELESNEIAHYSISNLMGQQFASGVVTDRPIDTSKLASGSYLLTVFYQDHKVSKRFIK
ncbi:T9SS type A sorting domain-containing protein [Seonamhaeicola marinus]|uniref:T9SS type A sorting domain-containing protein n=1 Tax=Seonamhaeicola marinus TaxID=1912246 RepID=A0A5D0HKH2_9FLAO|nr:T9SS type A sorting domain-containing protein [Seonamhaeicola marinus]TYA71460.1 T9SS type A sorting domain-containing protein [Seonamhaeicola marinus]